MKTATKIYSSQTGSQGRRRRRVRGLGQPTIEVLAELRKMDYFEQKQFAIRASMGLLAIGVTLMK